MSSDCKVPSVVLHPSASTSFDDTNDSRRTDDKDVLGDISNVDPGNAFRDDNQDQEEQDNTLNNQLNTSNNKKDNASNIKENKGFMKRMLSRGLKLKSENNPPSSTADSSTKTRTLSRKKSKSVLPPSSASPSVSGDADLRSTASSRTITRQHLSRTGLISSPAKDFASGSSSVRVTAPQQQQSNMMNKTAPPRKNFVKANMIAAANAKMKTSTTSTHLEIPSNPRNLGAVDKKLGGSSRSLNSDPGTSSSSSSFKRGGVDQLRKSYHSSRTTTNQGAKSAKPRPNQAPVNRTYNRSHPSSVTPNSKIVDERSNKSVPRTRPSPRTRRSPRHNQALEQPSTQFLQLENDPSSQESSRRSSLSSLESELLKSLKQKQEYFQLVIENLQTNIEDLRLKLETSEENYKVLSETVQSELKDLVKKSNQEKQELKEFYIYQLENQRLEIRDEMRQLLSFKEKSSHSSSLMPPPQDNEGRSSSFQDSKEKLFHKIHRLSARMSMQDLDMKEMQEVKTWNERKLENELTRLQDSVVKTTPTEKVKTMELDTKTLLTGRPGSLEQSLSMVGSCSLSEPDLTEV